MLILTTPVLYGGFHASVGSTQQQLDLSYYSTLGSGTQNGYFHRKLNMDFIFDHFNFSIHCIA